jgi:hypothetical protein
VGVEGGGGRDSCECLLLCCAELWVLGAAADKGQHGMREASRGKLRTAGAADLQVICVLKLSLCSAWGGSGRWGIVQDVFAVQHNNNTAGGELHKHPLMCRANKLGRLGVVQTH